MNDYLYTEIAYHIIGMIPVKWKEVYYLGEVEPNKASYSSVFYFLDDDNNIVRSHDIPEKYNVSKEIYLKLLDALDELMLKSYDNFVSDGNAPWEQMSIVFVNNGELNAKYYYDLFEDKDSNQVVREVIWAYNTFKYIPENNFLKSLLDTHLKSLDQ